MNYGGGTNTSVVSRPEGEIAAGSNQGYQLDQQGQQQDLSVSAGKSSLDDCNNKSSNAPHDDVGVQTQEEDVNKPNQKQLQQSQQQKHPHIKHVQQQIHTNGSPEKKPSRKNKQAQKAHDDQFVDVDEHDRPQEDEIVIPEHLISQVHTNVNSKNDNDKRLSTVTTSSYTKKVKKNYVGPWKLGRTLGRGATGRVRLAKHSESGQYAAVKIVPKATLNGNHDSHISDGIEREIIIMKLISHPNIMALYDVWENKEELYLILEYVERGELFNYLVKKIRLEEKEAVHYFKQIISGVNYCHSFNICHRDLKPENLLLDKHHNIKIADFGMAALEVTNKMLNTSCGSPHYASPEVVMGESYHGGPSDIWSCGIILYALLTGHLPFDDDHMTRLLAKVRSGIFRIPGFVSPEARDLIKKMLTVNPEKRISIEEILAHPLLKKYPDTGFYYPRIKNKNYMDSPLPKDIMKQPIPAETIDKEILKNLQTLWHGEKKSKIVEKLMSNEETAEKLFYYLLLKYRQEHSLPLTNKGKSKKKNIMQTKGDTTARDLIKEKKMAMTKSTSIVSTTITDDKGNKTTQISKEPLSNSAKIKSTSYKKLTNSKYSLNRMETSTSRSNLATGSSANNINKRKSRDIEGHLIISASSSYRKGISFHNTHARTKSSNSFKSFKNTSPYNSLYNFNNYQGIDATVALGEQEKENRANIPVPIKNKAVSPTIGAPTGSGASESVPAKRDSGSHSVMTKSASKRDSFNAFIGLGSIENYAAIIDHPFGLASSNSGKSLTSPKKKQRKSLTGSTSAAGDITASNSVKRLSGVSGRSRRSTINNSTSKRSIRYKSKTKNELLKKPALNLPELPKLPNEKAAKKASSMTAKKILSREDFTSGLSTNEFAFFCERVFGFDKDAAKKKNNPLLMSDLSNYDELQREYQIRLERQKLEEIRKKQEELKKEKERLQAIDQANSLALKVKEMTEKARLLEMENQRLVKERELEREWEKEKEKRSASLPAEQENEVFDPQKMKQRRAVSEFDQASSPKSSPTKKGSKVGKSPKKKKSILGVNSTLLNSPTGDLVDSKSTPQGSPEKKQPGKSELKTLPSHLTAATSDYDRFQDAFESLGRQNTNSTFSFNFGSSKHQSIISGSSLVGEKKPTFNFGNAGITKSLATTEEEKEKEKESASKGRNVGTPERAPDSKFEVSYPSPPSSGFDFKVDKKTSIFTSTFSEDSPSAVRKFSFGSNNNNNSPTPTGESTHIDHKPINTQLASNNTKLEKSKRASIKTPPVNSKFPLVPQRDAPKPPQSKTSVTNSTLSSSNSTTLVSSPNSGVNNKGKNTQTNVKSVIAKGSNVILNATTTTITTGNNNNTVNKKSAADGEVEGEAVGGMPNLGPVVPVGPASASTPTTVITSAHATGSTSDNAAAGDLIRNSDDVVSTVSSTSKTVTGKPSRAVVTASSKLSTLDKAANDSTSTAADKESTDDAKETEVVESKHSKAPSITTTAGSSIITNPKTKQSWFSKVINNFVPSASHEDEFRYESFLLVEDVQTLIRNSLTLRLKEGSVSKVKFDSNGVSAVVPAKLANGRSLKVKISINPVKGAKHETRVINFKKKSIVTVVKEKGSAKAFSKMGQAIHLTIQNEENQFKTRETRLLSR